jgi:hypothetical protein
MNNLGLNGRFTNLIYNTIKNAKVSGNIRKTRWLFDRASKGFFYGIDKGDESSARIFANQMDSMITVLNGMHQDRWDFDIRPTYTRDLDNRRVFSGFQLSVVIHYPEIEITNTEERCHNIKDLFIEFQVKKSDFTNDNGEPVWGMYNLKGTRSYLTYDEWFVGYLHSHLPSNKFNSFSDAFKLGNFCLGDNTEIVNQQEELYMNYTPEGFELFLWTLDSLVRWESIEGVPHIRIERIKVGSEVNQVSISDTRNLAEYYDNMRTMISNLDVDFVFSEYRYKIKKNNKFERFVHNLIVNYLSHTWKHLLVTRNNGSYYGYNHPNIETPEQLRRKFETNSELPHFYLRSNKVEFKVEPYSGDLPDINDYKVHPKFLEYAATRLEQELYSKSVRKSTIERYHQIDNAQEHVA